MSVRDESLAKTISSELIDIEELKTAQSIGESQIRIKHYVSDVIDLGFRVLWGNYFFNTTTYGGTTTISATATDLPEGQPAMANCMVEVLYSSDGNQRIPDGQIKATDKYAQFSCSTYNDYADPRTIRVTFFGGTSGAGQEPGANIKVVFHIYSACELVGEDIHEYEK